MYCMHLAGDVLKPTLLQGTREINMRGAKIKAMSDESSFYMK